MFSVAMECCAGFVYKNDNMPGRPYFQKMVKNSIGRLENQEYQNQLSLPARNCMEQQRAKSERGALTTALLFYSGFWLSACMDSVNSLMISERYGLSFLKMIEAKLTTPSLSIMEEDKVVNSDLRL